MASVPNSGTSSTGEQAALETAYRAEDGQFQARLLHSETDCHEARQATKRLTGQNMSLTTLALHFETALKHNELQTAQLPTSYDTNRSNLGEEDIRKQGAKSTKQIRKKHGGGFPKTTGQATEPKS